MTDLVELATKLEQYRNKVVITRSGNDQSGFSHKLNANQVQTVEGLVIDLIERQEHSERILSI